MKKALGTLIGLAALLAMHSSPFNHNDGSIGHGIPDNPKKIIPAGCKEYTFYGFTVVALSEKRAIEKCRKLRDRQNQPPNN